MLLIITLIKKEEMIIVPDESIRFRVVANSNSEEDISAKENAVKNLSKIINNISTSSTIEESRKNINKNLELIKNNINETFDSINYNKSYEINYGINYFPKKIYKGVKYNEGYYESLLIKIGDGKGNNYWCVLFPPLCMIDEDIKGKDIEYKFIISEIIEKFKSIKEKK